jgi:dCTP deaminase
MILTGSEIEREILAGRVVITPFDTTHIEPNSYGFHLAPQLICYQDAIVDAREKPVEQHITIPPSGYCLEPGRFYLGSTFFYAATLDARHSTATMGIWIQFSAPLGHTGAIIPWTLEITVIHPVIVYPEMPIGKIAFWRPQGATSIYNGKYVGSREVVSSRLFEEGGDDA